MPKEAAYREAEKKIEAALKSGTTELDLSQSYDAKDEEKLTELPESIGKLKRLTLLNLSNNQLTTLPDSIGQLTELQELDLTHNNLTSLPDFLRQLTQLKILRFPENQLKKLPESLSYMIQLEELVLYENQLTAIQEWLGNITNLRILNLGCTNLTKVPNTIRKLRNLEELQIWDNKIQTVPEWIGELNSLKSLNIHSNKISKLPESLANLSNLNRLFIGYARGGNELEFLPDSIRQFKKLEALGLGYMKLSKVPDWVGELNNLHELDLRANNITNIPYFIAKLDHLEILDLGDNPLNPALQSAYDACSYGNYEPLKAYLRSLEQNAEPLYEAKLVLVGEGDVGKTTLLKALKGDAGDAPKEGETTTHGIDIHKMQLPHPEMEAVAIQLNAWDFGEQDVYRVTHQFFFSRRSLYLLVWEPRGGVQKGQVEDWLNMIRLRVGADARVIIVSTYTKTGERIARVDQPVFLRDYPDMIAGFYEVDSLVPYEETGEMFGIDQLKKAIAEESAKLEQMGMLFNNNWKAARDELIESEAPRISYTMFAEVCEKHTLSEIEASTLAGLMHDLGYIVHYGDDENLCEDVVLKPQWLTKAIGFVLEDRATQDAEGILPDERLFEVWHDHQFKDEPRYTPDLYPFFLRLMEKYDVSYRLPDGKASLVAQHVPQVRPELPWLPEQEKPANLRRIAMICAMDEDPPGLMPWMIVRTRDFMRLKKRIVTMAVSITCTGKKASSCATNRMAKLLSRNVDASCTSTLRQIGHNIL